MGPLFYNNMMDRVGDIKIRDLSTSYENIHTEFHTN